MKIGSTLYFDHQATTPTDERVLAAMRPYYDERFGNPHSADHALGWEAARATEAAASKIAMMLGADADEIVFTSGATESNNLALIGAAYAAKNGSRDRILVSATEHKSILALTRFLREQLDYKIEILPANWEGKVDVEYFKKKIDDDVLIVSTIYVNNEIGSIINEIGDICRSNGVLFHCDGAQSPIALDLKDIATSVDLFSLSGHKMYGPKGIGALFAHRDIQDRITPIIHGGGQQGQLRSGTLPTPLCVGMGAAADIISNGSMEDERLELRSLRDLFVRSLQQLNWPIFLNGPSLADRHPGNANIRFEGFSAHDILDALQPKLAASTGSACTTGIPEPSHVLTAIGLSQDQAEASVRFSIGRQTQEEHVDEAVALIKTVLERLSGAGLSEAV